MPSGGLDSGFISAFMAGFGLLEAAAFTMAVFVVAVSMVRRALRAALGSPEL